VATASWTRLQVNNVTALSAVTLLEVVRGAAAAKRLRKRQRPSLPNNRDRPVCSTEPRRALGHPAAFRSSRSFIGCAPPLRWVWPGRGHLTPLLEQPSVLFPGCLSL